jgi:hypothetical protein
MISYCGLVLAFNAVFSLESIMMFSKQVAAFGCFANIGNKGMLLDASWSNGIGRKSTLVFGFDSRHLGLVGSVPPSEIIIIIIYPFSNAIGTDDKERIDHMARNEQGRRQLGNTTRNSE